jgi:hypothetical protein
MSYLPVGGKLFLPLNDNLGDRDVADIALLPSGEIFVSKNGDGIYRATGSLPRLRVEDRTTTQSISVFPNPAASVLQIRTANAGVVSQVMCTDAVGRTVSLPRSESGEYDVRNLKDGAYLIRLVSTTGVTTGRVIIKH